MTYQHEYYIHGNKTTETVHLPMHLKDGYRYYAWIDPRKLVSVYLCDKPMLVITEPMDSEKTNLIHYPKITEIEFQLALGIALQKFEEYAAKPELTIKDQL